MLHIIHTKIKQIFNFDLDVFILKLKIKYFIKKKKNKFVIKLLYKVKTLSKLFKNYSTNKNDNLIIISKINFCLNALCAMYFLFFSCFPYTSDNYEEF